MKANSSLSSTLLLFASLSHASYIGRRQDTPQQGASPLVAGLSDAEASSISAAIAAQRIADSDNNKAGISGGHVDTNNPDPCGIPTGQPASFKNTCHEPVNVKDPTQLTSYGVQCLKVPQEYGSTIRQDKCAAAALAVCQLMSHNQATNAYAVAGQTTDQWVWDTVGNAEGQTEVDPGCTFGYW